MPDYRRNRVPGGTFFFTVNLLDPVKHGLVEHSADWPHSSFRWCVEAGLHPDGWRGGSD
jgi:REP-associated tyrosine transposase